MANSHAAASAAARSAAGDARSQAWTVPGPAAPGLGIEVDEASTNLLSALQLLVRRMINVAYLYPSAWMSPDSLDPKMWKDRDPNSEPEVAAFFEATVGWNNVLYRALLIAPPSVATKIPKLYREVDRLIDLAVSRIWTRTEFRRERAILGRMAAEYLRLARSLAGLPDIELRSIWTWDPGLDRTGQNGQSAEPDLPGSSA